MSENFQGDMLNFCDFIQVYVFTSNHHLNSWVCKNKPNNFFIGSLTNKLPLIST